MPDQRPDIRICDNYDIRIDRNGQWWHQGARMTRHNLVVLFARQLVRAADGSYWLQTPAEKGMIAVEDLPLMVTAAEHRDGRLVLTTNCDDSVMVGGNHPLRMDCVDDEWRPAVHVRGGIWARVSRAVYYDLARHVVADPSGSGRHGIVSDGHFFALEAHPQTGGAAA